jgi:carbon monoxide dehydrogenase subunit G
MVFDQHTVVAAPAEKVWELISDVPRMAGCLPGLEDLRQEGPDTYAGTLEVAVGPIAVKLEGRMQLERHDRDAWTTLLVIKAEDRRIRSSTNARTTMRLVPNGEHTELIVHTEATVLGKLGQMGQAVLRKKSDQLLAQFVENMAAALGGAAAETT